MGESNLMELCHLASTEVDKTKKRKFNELIAKELCHNKHDLQLMKEALNEPLRNNKGIKRKEKTRYTYNLK